jgi:ketosteroid isomerase-like protein
LHQGIMARESELVAVDHTMRSYYAAVSQDDAAAAARHFTVPAMFMTQKGVWSPTTTAAIEASYVAMLRDYSAQGYSHSTSSESHMQLLGETTALASFVVVRHRTGGTEIGTFGFTYLLRKGAGAWQIAVLIGHPPHDVLRFV